jgi:hypothetical protein
MARTGSFIEDNSTGMPPVSTDSVSAVYRGPKKKIES